MSLNLERKELQAMNGCLRDQVGNKFHNCMFLIEVFPFLGGKGGGLNLQRKPLKENNFLRSLLENNVQVLVYTLKRLIRSSV